MQPLVCYEYEGSVLRTKGTSTRPSTYRFLFLTQRIPELLIDDICRFTEIIIKCDEKPSGKMTSKVSPESPGQESKWNLMCTLSEKLAYCSKHACQTRTGETICSEGRQRKNPHGVYALLDGWSLTVSIYIRNDFIIQASRESRNSPTTNATTGNVIDLQTC